MPRRHARRGAPERMARRGGPRRCTPVENAPPNRPSRGVGNHGAARGGVELRLDQVMTRGWPWARGAHRCGWPPCAWGKPPTGSGRGLAVQAEGATLRYRRLPQPPRVKYTLESKDGGDSFELRPGEMKPFMAGAFPSRGTPDAARTAVLQRTARLDHTARNAGRAFLVTVTGGWLVLRLGEEQTHGHGRHEKGDEEDWAG